jgi:hypothetical protein
MEHAVQANGTLAATADSIIVPLGIICGRNEVSGERGGLNGSLAKKVDHRFDPKRTFVIDELRDCTTS